MIGPGILAPRGWSSRSQHCYFASGGGRRLQRSAVWLWLHFPSLLIHCSYLKNFLICFLKSWRESRHLHFLIKHSPCYEKENPSGLAPSGQTQHVVTYCYQIHDRNRLSGFNPRYLFPITVQYCLFLIWWLLWPHRLLFCAFPKPEKKPHFFSLL